MGLVIGHIDLPISGAKGIQLDLEHDIPWTTLACIAHQIRGDYVELISRSGILLRITSHGISHDVAGYAHMLFDGGTLVVHADGTAEYYNVRETADEIGRWAFVYPDDLTML